MTNSPTPTKDLALPALPDFTWPILPATGPLISGRATAGVVYGTLETSFLTSTTASMYAELEHLIVPGLRASGIEATVIGLPAAGPETEELLSHLATDTPFPVFGFNSEPIPDEATEDPGDVATEERDAAGYRVEQDRNRTLRRAGFLLMSVLGEAIWLDAPGQQRSGSVEAFRSIFSVAVPLRTAKGRLTRRVAALAAIQRVVVFALAFPDRLVSGEDADADRRERASRFLWGAAGKQRDAVSLRWRLAGDSLQARNIDAALEQLYDAALRALNLPSAVHEALAWPMGPLSHVQQRELVYLARAGNRDLKVFTARRLATERETPGVAQTLTELAFYPDPLVRAAAMISLSPSR